ncbi:hypothetical protein AB0K40_17885 [Nonomuraea bangladeshensis]|uniref:Uncharacterized protein n=1 Tax=Nonomuraea bangladeshensis TaxID=404385 RepID=A0ABV3H4D4_9ACTN
MTWETRDLPVLKAIVEMTDEGAWHIKPQEVAERTGLSQDDVEVAFAALAAEHPPFFSFIDATSLASKRREIGRVYNPTGHARRTVGTWPTAERLADRIIVGLERAADAEEDEEKRGRLKRMAAWFGGAGREVLIEVAGSAISKGMGL